MDPADIEFLTGNCDGVGLFEYCKKVYPERFFDILYSNEDIFKDNCQGNKLYCEFKDKEERVHWFQGIINNEKEYLNIPLHTPINQL